MLLALGVLDLQCLKEGQRLYCTGRERLLPSLPPSLLPLLLSSQSPICSFLLLPPSRSIHVVSSSSPLLFTLTH